MRSPLAQPDPRVLSIINHALDEGTYEPATQMMLVRCFANVFGDEDWWRQMLRNNPSIAAVVRLATSHTLH
jgi:hypothetical protein